MRQAGLLLAGLACIAAAPPMTHEPVTIVAHRGLTEGVAENTLAAFRKSIQRGVKIIELDLRVTGDGQLVVIHDKTLDRTTDCTGPVAERALAEIRACDAGNGERVPTFAEVVALVRDQHAHILADVKNGTPIEPVIREVHGHRMDKQVILGLHSTEHVARARAALPDTIILAYMLEVADGPAFVRAGAHIIRLWSDWVENDRALIFRTRELGPRVWVMVGRRLPSDSAEWRELHGRMIAAGAQGLITDRPHLVSSP
jgi:glycerophosphoryl diester phosphodiesterase